MFLSFFALQTENSSFIGVDERSDLSGDYNDTTLYIAAIYMDDSVKIVPCAANGEGYSFGEDGKITYAQMTQNYGDVPIRLVDASNMG